jgi:hypothetical protein
MGREKATYPINQYDHLLIGVAEVFDRRERGPQSRTHKSNLSGPDREVFLEVFWGLFREGIITLGLNDSNRDFPFFRITEFGKKVANNQQAYFFHDVAGYEKQIESEVPGIDAVTLIYLKEAMHSFRSGCMLASTVMLGVATEHTFLLLLDAVEQSPIHSSLYVNVREQRTILLKVNKFKNILEQHLEDLPSRIKEDLETNFASILALIRTFRNQSGHPTGKIVEREQAYVLLQLFIPYCKKMYQLIAHFQQTRETAAGAHT